MNENETKILVARQEGESFCELSDLEKRVAVDQIMFRGAAICGCALPQTEVFAKFIAEEFTEYILRFGYEELTLEEILLALRINSYGRIINPAGEDLEQVPFTGNCMNVVYIAKVLKNYKVLRVNLDRRFENMIDGY